VNESGESCVRELPLSHVKSANAKGSRVRLVSASHGPDWARAALASSNAAIAEREQDSMRIRE